VAHLAHLFGSLVIEKLGEIFGRRIDRVERRLVVQELMVDIADELSQDTFKVTEIKE
jgi:hypothetical protein